MEKGLETKPLHLVYFLYRCITPKINSKNQLQGKKIEGRETKTPKILKQLAYQKTDIVVRW